MIKRLRPFLVGLLAFVLAVAAPVQSVQSFGLGKLGAQFGRLGLPGIASVPSWVLRGSNGAVAKFQRNAALNQYWFNGRVYGTDAALNTAAGGVNSGAARVYGPYVDPTNTNLLTNGDFSNGTTGWTAFGSGASINVVGGEMVLTGGGTLNNAFTQGVATTLGTAFKLAGTGRKGTTTSSLVLGSSINPNLNPGPQSAAITTTSNTAVSALGSAEAATTYFGGTHFSTLTGTGIFSNLSLVQVWPLSNWAPNNIVVLIEATTPTTPGVDQVVWQSDVASERDRIRVVRLTADNHLHVIVTANNIAQADLDMGVVADATFFSLAFSAAQNLFGASLNGGVPVTDVSGLCPGAGVMQIGKSFTGNAWTGTDPFVVVF
jgi:hypothetical protein